MKFKFSFLILLSNCLFILQIANGQVRLPQLISDGMVLQRDTKTTVWGWASPGEKLTIKFNQHTYKAVAGVSGRWFAKLTAMKAGGPYTMEISASNHITIRDILIGDVWFCSGQSNMVLPMERVKEKYPEEIAKADYPQIRNFFISTVSDIGKVHDDLPPGKWEDANPKNVLNFGAASYFFAKRQVQLLCATAKAKAARGRTSGLY